jgi:serine/threonine-protein kinase
MDESPSRNRLWPQADESEAIGSEARDASAPYLSGGRRRHLPVALPPGCELAERFVVGESVGSGASGTVYRAHDRVRQTDVALKVIDAGPWRPEQGPCGTAGRFGVPKQLCDFRHVLQTYDTCTCRRHGRCLLLISMEYADGGSLRQWFVVHRDTLEQRRQAGVALFEEACSGVAVLHAAGALHLDLKPENLLLVSGALKVADYAMPSERVSDEADGDDLENSPAGGSPAYMSPEQFTAETRRELDVTADVYALGCILSEILHPACRPPYAGSVAALREQYTAAPVPTLPGVSAKLNRIVERCLQKDRAARYGSVSDLLKDLQAALHGQAANNTADRWHRACSAFGAGRFVEASAVCRELLQGQPDHPGASGLLHELEARRQHAEQLYAVMTRDMERRSLGDLAEFLSEAIDTYPDCPTGRSILSELALKARRFREAVCTAQAALGTGDVPRALVSYQLAEQLNPTHVPTRQAVEMLRGLASRIDALRVRLAEAMAAGDRPAVRQLTSSLHRCLESAAQRGDGAPEVDER